MGNETFKDLILVINSIDITTGGTWAKFVKFGGPASHLSGRGRLQKY